MKQLVYRQRLLTRLTHWIWAASLFFLLLSGLQIFNAHPTLYLGNESGFEYDNAVLAVYAVDGENGPEGRVDILGSTFRTTGVLGVSGSANAPNYQAFPSALTIPSYRDLATGRAVHFFFAWVLVGTLLLWLVGSVLNGHLKNELLPSAFDIRSLPSDFLNHLKFRLQHGKAYNPMQKLTYCMVFFALFPMIVITGLAMSPGMDAVWPLTEWLGGRQTARTLHFVTVLLLSAFFVIHIMMVFAAGPINEMRSMISGWYRADFPKKNEDRHP
ncbi:cytochrome b/b6 domain-containing protein [Brucella grignonensis]|uniref:Prokaryotic cytochrome b561 family protein n=1 Tax=Brucella grignonensis TaxID=94627 RepID=A0A256F0Z2_9HYPH|nr:cytochrome b/b6 domain-containing protein [Brucella grignonensis]NKB84468.1 cytochrome b/b6 domain-containing protein [Brucella grignonensis]OYR08453.1 prokaryotic cytochrome b561 family protein [Brucella grignonensis]